MNNRLQEILNWANDQGVDLDNANLDLRGFEVLFYQHRETRANFRTVKKAIGGFEKQSDPPYVQLEKKVEIAWIRTDDETHLDTWTIKWAGAYKCNISYDCVAESFADDEIENAEIEDWQQDKAEDCSGTVGAEDID